MRKEDEVILSLSYIIFSPFGTLKTSNVDKGCHRRELDLRRERRSPLWSSHTATRADPPAAGVTETQFRNQTIPRALRKVKAEAGHT